MHIVYDARWFPVDDRFDGVGRYAYELARELSRNSSVDTITWLIHDQRQRVKLPTSDYVLVNRPDDIVSEIRLTKKLNRLGADVVYSPFYLMGFGLGKRTYKLVLTIHDLTYFHYRTPPHWLKAYQRAAWFLWNSLKFPTKLLLARADRVATVSETVADELVAAGFVKNRPTVVSNAVSQVQSIPKRDHSASKSIVYMGAFTQYKNVELLIDALSGLPDCQLNLLSKAPVARRASLEKRARDNAVNSHVVFHDGVDDKTYATELANARCLITASKSEGFGLPILEAQVHGTPVVCSDIPIFREVAGDGALFFDPTSQTACVDAIRRLEDPELSHALVLKGRKNAASFTWKQSAKQAAKVCQELAS